MPWNSEGGGGGGQGPWGQGPWGQGGGPRRPNTGGGRGPNPPDLEELIRKGQDKLKQVLPQGGGGSFGWLLAVGFAAVVVIFNSIYQVQPDERGVVLRFGTFNRIAEPGLHFALWPVETMERPKVGAVRQINIGSDGDDGQMLTSDKNIINVPFSVFWRINNAKDFLFNVADQEQVISAVSQSAMREVVGQTRAQVILTTGKNTVEAQVVEITQKLLDEYGAGVTLSSVNLGNVQPPGQVADAFAEVVRAGQNQQQLINQAEQYRNQKYRQTDGDAAKLIEDANAYKAATVAEAQGEAARFLSVYEQYKNARDVTRERIFLETMENVLGGANKVIVEPGAGGQGVVPYLPLPEVKARSGAAQN
ncbi:FtsH protease activity modulator HflK [Aestuariivirga sp.]|uniref:FtsH protease activity modulator HflK n=1 Tax=Aestuariivirga sp. TaxID=2650926 RepID=UPI0025BA0BB1|nr:FtsH protease activity modulator HflK [Aestuariivirga sp.]MCA3554687.1 FtsH protease activity modulator HflK [Aestuariivirga sp.]